MAKRKSKKKSHSFWHWALVAVAAFLFYRGLDFYLNPKHANSKKTPPASKIPAHIAEDSAAKPAPSPAALSAPLPHWDFESAGRLLPAGSYPDNYLPVAVKNSQGGLLAYAKVLPGKKPGPQGLTHTQPGLGFYHWKESQYQDQEIKFSDLEVSLSGLSAKKLTGIPQISKKPWIEGEPEVFSVKLFLEDDPRQITAFVIVDAGGAAWTQALRADGKTSPAAFVQGTTRDTTRQVRTDKHDGKNFVIVETGKLDLARAYEGYRWKVEAYAWEGNSLVFDKDYSEKLTKEKKK